MIPRLTRAFGAICFLCCCTLLASAQSALAAPYSGLACRTTASGDWDNPATWENCGGGVPGVTDAAYVQAGHTVTLTGNAAVGDLHISSGTTSATAGGDGKVALVSYTLDLNGILRCYYAPIGTTPGTATTTIPSQPLTVAPENPGRLRIVGATRTVINGGEWSASNTASESSYRLEVAADADAIITLATPVKAAAMTFTSGVTDVGSNRLAVDISGAGTGDVYISADATLISSASGASSPVASRTTTGAAGALNVDGRLSLKGNSPYVGMNTIAFSGTVEFVGNNQTTIQGMGGGVTPSAYHTLVISGTGVKTLGADATVTARLTRGGASSLALNGNTLTYAPGAVVAYAGDTTQITGPELLAAVDGLAVANAAGVTLGADVAVNDQLDLTGGDLATGAFTLDLGPAAACTGAGDVTGTIRRTTVNAGAVYCFGNPDVRVGVNTGGTTPSSITVTLAHGAAPFNGAVLRQYSIAAPGFAGTGTLRLHYTGDDLNGNAANALYLWRNDGVRWIAQTPSTRGDGYVEKNDVTAFSDWALSEDGDSTAADVAVFDAGWFSGAARLAWTTASEANLAGFHLDRSATPTGERRRITLDLIPARFAGQVAGAEYTWLDYSAAIGVEQPLYYWLEAVDMQGQSTWHGPAMVYAATIYLPVVAGE